MLTNEELMDVICSIPPGRPLDLLLAVGRAVEAKVLEKHRAFAEGKTCRTCAHLDTDPRQAPCALRRLPRLRGLGGAPCGLR